MTQDEIIELAKQAGAVYSNDHAASLLDDEIIIFAKLVAAKEREIVAVFLEKQCEEQYLADRVRSREFNGAEKWMK